tara:strand:- start:2583 stop:2789 length:207 start_codon:yes stop_codon:yes gene_type:complete
MSEHEPQNLCVEIDCVILNETKDGYLIDDGLRQIWIPKSQVFESEIDDVHREGIIIIPEWLAMEKELI